MDFNRRQKIFRLPYRICAFCASLCLFAVYFANNVVQILQKNGQKYVKKVSLPVFCLCFETKSLKKPFCASTKLTQFF